MSAKVIKTKVIKAKYDPNDPYTMDLEHLRQYSKRCYNELSAYIDFNIEPEDAMVAKDREYYHILDDENLDMCWCEVIKTDNLIESFGGEPFSPYNFEEVYTIEPDKMTVALDPPRIDGTNKVGATYYQTMGGGESAGWCVAQTSRQVVFHRHFSINTGVRITKPLNEREERSFQFVPKDEKRGVPARVFYIKQFKKE